MTPAGGGRVVATVAPRDVVRIRFDRPDRHNGINGALLDEVGAALDTAENLPGCRLVVLEGTGGVFSTGMDLAEAAGPGTETDPREWAARGGAVFYGLLRRLTTMPRVVLSLVDGRAAGGGVGIAAASDLVHATPRSAFSLPEALWGLLPACVLPFLIRRTGFQPAYAMTLSTLPVTAARAERTGLVDEVSTDPERLVQRLADRLARLDDAVIRQAKDYVRRLWILDEDTERLAVGEFTRLMSSAAVRARIGDYAAERRFPWDAASRADGEAPR